MVLVHEWKDIYVSDKEFIRELGKSIYHYKENKFILHKIIKHTKPIPPLKINSSETLNQKIITMDSV